MMGGLEHTGMGLGGHGRADGHGSARAGYGVVAGLKRRRPTRMWVTYSHVVKAPENVCFFVRRRHGRGRLLLVMLRR